MGDGIIIKLIKLKLSYNENGKKAIGLDWQNNSFTRASLHDYDAKMSNFTVCGGRERKTTTFS